MKKTMLLLRVMKNDDPLLFTSVKNLRTFLDENGLYLYGPDNGPLLVLEEGSDYMAGNVKRITVHS